MKLAAGQLNRRIRIERPIAKKGLTAAGSGRWVPVCTVWGNVQDVLPSRGERLADGMNVATGASRIRIRFRVDITSAMRVVIGTRIAQIVTAPAELGFREGLEFMVEGYTSAGNPA